MNNENLKEIISISQKLIILNRQLEKLKASNNIDVVFVVDSKWNHHEDADSVFEDMEEYTEDEILKDVKSTIIEKISIIIEQLEENLNRFYTV